MSLSTATAQGNAATTADTLLYTVPANTELWAGVIRAVNISAAAAGIRIYLDKSDSTYATTNIVHSERWLIPPGGTVTLTGILLPAGGSIGYQQGTASAFVLTFQGVEKT